MTMKHIAAVAVFAVLSACAQVGGLTGADTLNKQLAAGYATVTALDQTALSLKTAGKLAPADQANVVAVSQAAIAGLDIASASSATDPAGANAKLTSIMATLTALQAYLATKGH